MAGVGGFSGNLLGSFSGRGADVSPMQFIQELRQRAVQAEQQKKLQQQQMQQSFLVSLMQKKQQEAELQAQTQQAQQNQAYRQQESTRAAEQFKSEQQRIMDAEKAQQELRALSESRQSEELRQRGLEAKAQQDAVAQKRGLQAKGAEALTWVETQAAPILATNTERLGDPLKALDATEAWLLDAAQRDQDPERKAQTIAQISEWRAVQERKLLGRESLASSKEARAASAEDRALRTKAMQDAEARRQQEGAAKQASAKSRARQSIIQGPGGLLERAYDALALARTPEDRTTAQKKIDKLEAELEELALQTAGE